MRLTTKYLQSENYFADEISEDATEEERNKYLYSIITKLGQLEDIEDELGIDLITLFKALKNGYWYDMDNLKWKVGQFNLQLVNGDFALCSNTHDPFDAKPLVVAYLKDYGKTWALTKEELE